MHNQKKKSIVKEILVFPQVILKNFYVIFILYIFIFIVMSLMNLLPAIYDRVIETYGLAEGDATPLMVVEGFFVIIAAILSVFWGSSIDKVDRKKILYASIIIWTLGSTICTFSPNFPLFVFGRIITAIGIGAQMPVTYGLMADIIPPQFWSSIFGVLALFTSISNGAGNFLSGWLSPMNIWRLGWKFPFALMSLMSVICLILIVFAKLPSKGQSAISKISKDCGTAHSEEGKDTNNVVYPYSIKKEDIKPIWNIKTNRYMIIGSFFAVIPGATMGAMLIFYFIESPFTNFPVDIQTQVSSLFAAMAGIGYLLGTLVLGPIFDALQQNKTKSARAKFTYLGLFIAIPLFIIAMICIVPVDYTTLNLTDIDATNTSIDINMYVKIITAIFNTYPSYIAYFWVTLFGAFLASPLNINRTPILLDINVPEHQGTSQSMLNFSDQLGRGITSLFLAFQIVLLNWFSTTFDMKIILIMSILFYIPPTYCYWRISINFKKDSSKKTEILIERTQKTNRLRKKID